ncbi:Nephrocystin-3 [Cladobotryum mycophilum]|uniref:Nephrocystin-3 n=1 Tax=Cladobotryum mycophilum TaxID=491253 RepID=A0ABR0SUU8_9HYPO
MTDSLKPLRGLLHRVRGVVSLQRNSESSGLHIVKDAENAEIDIVAVHGLGGQGFKSWTTLDTKGGKSKSWLEELLATDVPNARIMTYAYISDGVNYRYLVRNVLYGRALDLVKELGSQRSRDGTSRRPLYFVAHSLGGWIIKRALIISSEAMDSELRDIELSTCGVAFFGTLSPGRPSSPSPLAHVIRRTTSGFDENPKSTRLDSTQPQSSDIEWLENQMEAFKAITANLPRISFHETKQSEDGGFVVEKRHSMSGSDGAQIGLSAAHSDLIKFRGRDANYMAFIDNFRGMIDGAKASGLLESKREVYELAAVHNSEYLKEGFDISYRLPGEPSIIIRRQDLLDKIDASFKPAADEQMLHLSIASLWGEAGAGKTMLAKHFAELHQDDISFVFWIYAESWETVVASYLEFANNLVIHYSKNAPRCQVENDLGLAGVEDMLRVKSIRQLDPSRVKSAVRAVKDWLLRPENNRWLLIFDNVEPSFDIFDFIPLTLTGKIILTSRDSSCCAWGTRIHVHAMKEEQAVELLGAVVGDGALEETAQAEAASRLVQGLKYHPQTISLAGSTIRKKGLTVFEYQQEVESNMPLRIMGSTIDQSPVTKTVLRVSAMLSSSAIPVALFRLNEASARAMNASAGIKAFQDTDRLDNVFQFLFEQNFIQTPSPDSPPSSQASSPISSQATSASSLESFILDPAAREHLRGTLTPGEKTENAWLACNICVDGIRDNETASSSLPEIHEFSRTMAPHAKTCYDDWSSVLEDRSDDDDVAWQVLGNVCMTQGLLEQAIGCFGLSLRHKSKMDAIERIQTSLALASLLQQAGQHKKSAEVLTSIDIASIDKALGFRVALAKASAAAARGSLIEEELGPTDTTTIGTVQKLASTLEQLGKMEEAQALYRRVYISYQNMFGQSHPMTVEALDELANISKESNAIDEAENLYKQSVEIKTRTLGPEHPSTAHAIQKLAVVDDMRCRYTDAKIKYQRALGIMAASFGRAHPLYTTTMENLALSCRLHARSLDDQDELFSFSSLERETTHSHRFTTDTTEPSWDREAALLRDATRTRAFDEAEKLYLDAVSIKKAARELYSEEQVVATGSKLREMYENEGFFEGCRDEKVSALMALLREVRRRGTV